jgi:hypothetical protein
LILRSSIVSSGKLSLPDSIRCVALFENFLFDFEFFLEHFLEELALFENFLLILSSFWCTFSRRVSSLRVASLQSVLCGADSLGNYLCSENCLFAFQFFVGHFLLKDLICFEHSLFVVRFFRGSFSCISISVLRIGS